MADDIKIPLPKYLGDIADRAAEKAAKLVIDEHIKLCEARKAVLAEGSKPGIDVRVDRLEVESAGRRRWLSLLVIAALGLIGKCVYDLIVWLRKLEQMT